MVKVYGYKDFWSGVFGAVFIIGGLVGSGVFGVFVEIKHKYKLAVILICLFSIVSTTGVMFTFIAKISWLTAIFCFLVGFFMIPIMAVGFDFGVEVTFPIGESMSTGLLMSAGQVMGIVYTVTAGALIDHSGKKGAVIANIIFIVSCFLAFIGSLFLKEDLRRFNLDEEIEHELEEERRQSHYQKDLAEISHET